MVGLCLIAVFVLAAITAGSASAKTPEWGKCEAKAGGKYEDSNCQTKAKGKTGVHAYEWAKGTTLPNIKFTSKNKVSGHGGVLTGNTRVCVGPKAEQFEEARWTRAACTAKGGHFEEEEAPPIECEEETAAGEQTGKNKVANVHVTFTGCKAIGSIPCNSPALASGEIKTNELKGELGYINAKTTPVQVGVLLTPTKKNGAFTQLECPALALALVVGVGNSKEGANYEPESKGGWDGIISPITPVNTMSSTFEQVYTVNPVTHENEPSSFEGKHIDLLEDYFHFPLTKPERTQSWSAAGEEVTTVNTPAEAGEIKA